MCMYIIIYKYKGKKKSQNAVCHLVATCLQPLYKWMLYCKEILTHVYKTRFDFAWY